MFTTERIAVLVEVRSGLIDLALPFNSIHLPQLLANAPILLPAKFEDLILWNQALGAWVQSIVMNGRNFNPTEYEPSDGAGNIAYFSG